MRLVAATAMIVLSWPVPQPVCRIYGRPFRFHRPPGRWIPEPRKATDGATATTTTVIVGVGVNGGALQIVGTSDDEHVTVNQQGNGSIELHADFLPAGNFKTFKADDVQLIFAILGGDAHLTIAGSVEKPAIVDGGAGNDHLNAGNVSSILLGGSGDNHINGGSEFLADPKGGTKREPPRESRWPNWLSTARSPGELARSRTRFPSKDRRSPWPFVVSARSGDCRKRPLMASPAKIKTTRPIKHKLAIKSRALERRVDAAPPPLRPVAVPADAGTPSSGVDISGKLGAACGATNGAISSAGVGAADLPAEWSTVALAAHPSGAKRCKSSARVLRPETRSAGAVSRVPGQTVLPSERADRRRVLRAACPLFPPTSVRCQTTTGRIVPGSPSREKCRRVMWRRVKYRRTKRRSILDDCGLFCQQRPAIPFAQSKCVLRYGQRRCHQQGVSRGI